MKTFAIRKILIALLAFISVLCCTFLAPLAGMAETVMVPILYATDRILDQSATSSIAFSNCQSDRLSFGIKNMPIVSPAATNDPSYLNGLGWWSIMPGQVPGAAPFPNTTLTEKDFFVQVKESIESGPSDRPLIVFAHGCCTDFEGGMVNAAKLANECEAPVILYAWCSIPPTMEKYRENEDTQRKNARFFSRFLSALSEYAIPERTVLIAHSMGNRFLHETLKDRYWDHEKEPSYPKFKCTIFACADVSIDDFASDEKAMAFNSQKTYVTKNDLDPALLMSMAQRGGYGRLGAPLKRLDRILSTDGVDVVAIEQVFGKNHALPVAVVSDLVNKQRRSYRPKFRQWPKRAHLLEIQK